MKKLCKPSFLLPIKLRVLPRGAFFMIIRCFVCLFFTLDNCDRPVRLVLSSSPSAVRPVKRQRPALWSDTATNFDEGACQILKQKGIFSERVWKGAMSKCCLCIFLSYHKEEVNINLGHKWTKLLGCLCAYQILCILSIKIHVTQLVPF